MLTVISIWGQKHLSAVMSLRELGSRPQSEEAWSFCSYFLKEAKEHGGKQVFLNSSFLNQGQYSIRERDGRRSQDRARLFSPVC